MNAKLNVLQMANKELKDISEYKNQKIEDLEKKSTYSQNVIKDLLKRIEKLESK